MDRLSDLLPTEAIEAPEKGEVDLSGSTSAGAPVPFFAKRTPLGSGQHLPFRFCNPPKSNGGGVTLWNEAGEPGPVAAGLGSPIRR